MSHDKAPILTALFAGTTLALTGCSSSSETTPPPTSAAEAAPTCTGQIAEHKVDKAFYYYIGKITDGNCVTMQLDPVPNSPKSIDLKENDGFNGGCVLLNPLRLQTHYQKGDLEYGGNVPITAAAAAAAVPSLPYCAPQSPQPSVAV